LKHVITPKTAGSTSTSATTVPESNAGNSGRKYAHDVFVVKRRGSSVLTTSFADATNPNGIIFKSREPETNVGSGLLEHEHLSAPSLTRRAMHENSEPTNCPGAWQNAIWKPSVAWMGLVLELE